MLLSGVYVHGCADGPRDACAVVRARARWSWLCAVGAYVEDVVGGADEERAVGGAQDSASLKERASKAEGVRLAEVDEMEGELMGDGEAEDGVTDERPAWACTHGSTRPHTPARTFPHTVRR
jgi:hypothetical protein